MAKRRKSKSRPSFWRLLVDGLADGSLARDAKRYLAAVKQGADPIEALHGHICSDDCWHNAFKREPPRDIESIREQQQRLRRKKSR